MLVCTLVFTYLYLFFPSLLVCDCNPSHFPYKIGNLVFGFMCQFLGFRGFLHMQAFTVNKSCGEGEAGRIGVGGLEGPSGAGIPVGEEGIGGSVGKGFSSSGGV